MMDYKNLSIVFDWVGSLLMLGTLWGWVYAKLLPAIMSKSNRSFRRLNAMERLFRQKYGVLGPEGWFVGGADERVHRVRTYRARLGIKPDWPPLVRALVDIANMIRIRSGYGKQKVSKEEYDEYEQYSEANRGVTRFLICYLVTTVLYFVRLILLATIHRTTASVFSGRAGHILFVIGFLLWNLSKGISLFLP